PGAGALNAAGTVSSSAGQRYAGKNEAEVARRPHFEFQRARCRDNSPYASGAGIQCHVVNWCRCREKLPLNSNNESVFPPTPPPRWKVCALFSPAQRRTVSITSTIGESLSAVSRVPPR